MKKQKGGKRQRSVSKWKDENWEGKRVVRTRRKGTTIKEREDQLAGSHTRGIPYGDETAITGGTNKILTRRRFKSKTDKEGNIKKQKEKIIYDDGNQMKKRKQKKIRFGKNKGKIRSKTVHWKDGKRTVSKRILDKADVSKLQTGGFLEAPIPRLFED